MRIGIYGGSFDPIHTGHAMVANFVAQCNVVDEVWLMVSRRNPLKTGGTYAGDRERLEMASIVARKCKGVRVTDIEMHRGVPSYTIETLRELQREHPDDSFKIIIGSDSLIKFREWRSWEEIVKDFGVIVYPRPGYPMPEKEPDNFIFLNGAPEFGISSTLIREYVRSGWNINYFVPTEVNEYIREKQLYL